MTNKETKSELPSKLPEPWYWTTQDLSQQLQKELSPQHVLYRRSIKSLARRQDNDDVLFQVFGSENNYAVVHLTWSGSSHADGKFPMTLMYKDWE